MIRSAIVNGDDFGLSPGINNGIIESYGEGILTSASLMATGEAFEEAVALARRNPGLSLGVHLTLVEGTPVLLPEKIPSLVTSEGRFFGSLGMFLTRWLSGRIRPREVQRELEAQVEKAMVGGIKVDKLDSHMHLHLLPGLFQIVLDLARKYRIAALRCPKERLLGRGTFPGLVGLWRRALLTSLAIPRAHRISMAGLFSPNHFSGVAESGRLTEDDLMRILQQLTPGVTEVMVHPGYHDSILDAWPQSRRYAREQEVRALTSPKVKALVRDLRIRLVSYRMVL